MKINPISSGIATASGLAQAARSSGKKAASTVTSGIQSVAAAASAFREVVSQYKVTNVSPQEFVEMLQKLHSAGAISEADYKDLLAIRSDLESEGIAPDAATNLIEFYTNRIAKLQKAQTNTLDPTTQTAIDTAQRRLDWLKKVAAVQSSGASVGVDKTA